MARKSPEVRKLAVAGVAALAVFGASATGAQAATKTLTYSCEYPLIGAQPLSIAIDAAIPDTVAANTPTAAFPVTAVATAGGDTYDGLNIIKAQTIEGTATAGATVKAPGGDIAVSVPTTIEPYTRPATAGDLTLNASGSTPVLEFPTAGTAPITVDSLNLNLRAKKADGSPVILPTDADSDGDPETFDVPCTLDPATQDTTLTTVTVTP